MSDEIIGRIGPGILALIGVEKGDGCAQADRLVERLATYRIFCDAQGRMNQSLEAVGGQLLVVSQFTLAANTRKGTRPSFSGAAAPDQAERLYDYFVQQCRARLDHVETGRYGADMAVSLTNDGPVTFWLQVSPEKKREIAT